MKVPRHARVSNFEVTFWLTYFQDIANTTTSRQSLEKKSCVSSGVAAGAVALFFPCFFKFLFGFWFI